MHQNKTRKYVQKDKRSGPCKGLFKYKGYRVVLQHPDNQVANLLYIFSLIIILRKSPGL